MLSLHRTQDALGHNAHAAERGARARILITAAREKGLVGMEGKEYVVKDGDIIEFLFNV